MRNKLIFDGKDLSDFGVNISGDGTFNSPEREYEKTSVPGRDGDIFYDENRLSNVTLEYKASIVKDFNNNIEKLRGFLLSRRGYKRLSDTYHPEEYRMAVYKGPLEVETTLLRSGEFKLSFDCKPQRYLVSGEKEITIKSDTTVSNPTFFSSRPYILVYGKGEIQVNGTALTISEHDFEYIEIDCETMNASYGANNCNGLISCSDIDFPKLDPGKNGIKLSGNIEKVVLTPRWWTV